jgi:hypothetical protein
VAQLSIPGRTVGELIDRIAALKRVLPRSQLYRLLNEASRQGAAHGRYPFIRPDKTAPAEVNRGHEALVAMFADYKRRAGQNTDIKLERLQVLQPADGRHAALAIDLGMTAMLWDYTDPFDVTATREEARL